MFAGLDCTVKVILMLDGNRRVMYSYVCPILFQVYKLQSIESNPGSHGWTHPCDEVGCVDK